MAQKTTVEHTDDIDGSPAEHIAVPFALDGVTYEIDLSGANYEKLQTTLAEWVAKGRRIGGRARLRSVGGTGKSTGTPPEAAKVRVWANENGYELSPRGRIPASIVEAYRTAMTTPEQESKPKSTGRRPAKKTKAS